MYILFLIIMLSGDELQFAPGGKVERFADKAACEAQAKVSQGELAKEPIGPFTLECRKV